MISQKFQATYDRINDTGNRLLQYLQELRAGRLKEGDSTQGLQSIEDNITKALKALTKQKYQVAVIAAMNAGKSTFLNAIIGADVLASEADACTVCRTDIRPIEAGQTPRLLEYRQGQRQPVVVAEGEVAELRQKFLKRTHEIRATANQDNTTRFELEHPIEAIGKLSSLAGFTLVDTPGPNEWKSARFNTVALKQTALEALRTCDAILFILDYTSFRDDTNLELLQNLVEQRKEFLAQSTGRLFFIINKIDRRTERDKRIVDVIESLKKALLEFGIPDPIIYPVSAWQGLLAKLIHQEKATDSDIKDFDDFFSARYAERDASGRRIIPLPEEIAPRALVDSGILTIQETVIQTITQNSGWNLLSEVLAVLNKAAQAIDDVFITEIRGWEVEFEQLKNKIEEYKQCSDSARNKITNVKKSIELQKPRLLDEFTKGIHKFADGAKNCIKIEIERVAKNQSKNPLLYEPVGKNLLTYIWNKLGFWVEGASTSSDPYKIRVKSRKDAWEVGQLINEYCAPIIQSFWLDTQDKLVRDGTKIREGLVQRIQNEIQEISDELSKFIGTALQIEIGVNTIQFPQFEFSGIDAKIEKQQEVITIIKKEPRTKSRCCASDEVYEIDVPIEETISYYEIDLHLTAKTIYYKIDEQVQRNIELLRRVIQKQVSEDFYNAEKQIKDYMNRFQSQFDYLLKERATKEVEAPQIISMLQSQRIEVNRYLNELESIQETLDSWKPIYLAN
ncbi:dynamin family protein [Scytonema sp. NUACC21]